jgi:hypothetical protein
MLTRIRWFIYGTAATLFATAMVVNRARQLRERLDAKGVRKVATSYGVDAMDRAGKYLQNTVPSVDQAPGG